MDYGGGRRPQPRGAVAGRRIRVSLSWASRRVRRAVRTGVRRLASIPVLHRGALSLVHAMNRRTFRILRAHPGVADVYVRGSFVRGPFVPIASDVDLVLVLHGEAGRSHAAVAAVHRALERARRANVSVRDRWHHMILDAERPLVEAYWPVFGAEEWRSADGGRPVACRSAGASRELSWALWSQICTSSGSLFHAYLQPAGRVYDFDAGLRKTLQLSSLLARLVEHPGPLHPDALADLRREEARRVASAFRPCGRDRAARRAAVRRVYRALHTAAASLDGREDGGGAPPPGAVIRSPQAAIFVLDDRLDDAEVEAAFDRLDVTLAGTRVPYVLSARVLRLFPFPPDDLILVGGGVFAVPSRRAHERHLFEALFLPSLSRLSIGLPDAGPPLARTALALLRAVLLYGYDTFPSSATAARRIALGTPDLLGRVPGLEPFLSRTPAVGAAPVDAFDLCARLAERLQVSLLAYADRTSHPAPEGRAR